MALTDVALYAMLTLIHIVYYGTYVATSFPNSHVYKMVDFEIEYNYTAQSGHNHYIYAVQFLGK